MFRILPLIVALLFVSACNARLYAPCVGSGECIPSHDPAGSTFRALALTVADPGNKLSTYTCAPITLWVKDRGGSALAVTQSTQVSLTGLGSGLAYASLANCQAATSSVSDIFLNIGEDHKTFYYRTSTAESLTLQISATEFDPGTLGVTTVLFQALGRLDDPTASLVSTESYPFSVHSDGTRLFVADNANYRVLVWNTMPTTNGQAASFALGQPNLTSNTENNGGLSASSMSLPFGVYSDGTRLFVADAFNNRVLVWNAIPTSNGQAASFALGQPDLTSNTSNNGGLSSASMYQPHGVYSDGTRLFVADTRNHRVLVWNTMPTSNGQAASFALGQPDLTSGTPNNGGASGSSMNFPTVVDSDGTRLFVADENNQRILVWNTVPTSNGQTASFALGQPDLSSVGFACSATSLAGPQGVHGDGTRLFIADTGNNRVLVWNTMPTSSGQAASFALGQPDLTSCTSNNGGISASSMFLPSGNVLPLRSLQ